MPSRNEEAGAAFFLYHRACFRAAGAIISAAMQDQTGQPRQALFNLPTVVTAAIGGLLAIHFIREYLLMPDQALWVTVAFAFIPARITAAADVATVLPGGQGAEIWSFLTYALLHADWGHVGLNCVWLAAFGSPVAWRFGAVRFLLFSAICAVAGAMLHLALHSNDMVPLVGASAGISGLMAAATRFALFHGMPLGGMAAGHPEVYRQPAAPLAAILRDSRVIVFLVIWFGINAAVGIFGSGTLASGTIAWEAHVGGFVAGLLLFPLFDPVPAEFPPARL
jgi:membrane associated rhomboid family serine protease